MISGTLWILFIFFSSCLGAKVYIDPDEEELVIPRGASLVLKCRSTENVKWIFNNSDVKDEVNYRSGSDYVASLTISNVTYLNVGFHKCQSTTDSKSIYIYVKDKDHLFTKDSINDENYIQNDIHGNVLIPCKPTDPSINVTLQDYVTNEDISYNPKEGFLLKNLPPNKEDYASYKCIFSKDDYEPNEIEYTVYVSHGEKLNIYAPVLNITHPHCIYVGQNLSIDCYSDLVTEGYFIDIDWDYPAKKIGLTDTRVHEENNDLDIGKDKKLKILMIENVTFTDSGQYVCTVSDYYKQHASKNISIQVVDVNHSHLKLRPLLDLYEITSPVNDKVIMSVIYSGCPEPELTWYSPKGEKIFKSNKYKISKKSNTDSDTIMLEIHNTTIYDTGIYSVKAKNNKHEKVLNITLLVEGAPANVRIIVHNKKNKEKYFIADKVYKLSCLATSVHSPDIKWYFKSCKNFPICEQVYEELLAKNYDHTEVGFEPKGVNDVSSTTEESFSKQVKYEVSSILSFTANRTGFIMCEACSHRNKTGNYMCSKSKEIEIVVSDVLDGFSLDGPNVILEDDNVTVQCGANKYYFEPEVEIFYERVPGESSKISNSSGGVIVLNHSSRFSNQIELKFSHISISKSGNYICKAKRKQDRDYLQKTYNMFIHRLEPPKFSDNNNVKDDTCNTTTKTLNFEFRCLVSGTPFPNITWKKNNEIILLSENEKRREFLEDRQILRIEYTEPEDEGTYTCIASNKVGTIQASETLMISDKPKEYEHTDLFVLIALLLLLVMCAIIIYKIRRKANKLQKKLKAGLVGQVNSLNPELGLHDQVDNLPYHTHWEFPRKKLKLGTQLGAGAFGVVMKADAKDIIKKGETTTVAVKMLKKTNDFTVRSDDMKNPLDMYLSALTSELKILVHLGKHLNIVNLLGACTKNIENRELLVIVEYCKHGNLNQYLLKHREFFIDQIENGKLNPNKMTRTPRYVNLPPLHATSNAARSISTTQNTMLSCNTDSTLCNYDIKQELTTGPDGYEIPDPVNGFGDDNSENIKITTQDLICWSYQVARGMEYLGSRKILHGDLAARNILLSEDKIVKICDFGLAKSMYSRDDYTKTSETPLPLKWMAIESIRDRVFSTQSDVWAFGVVLWEFFTLAESPYADIKSQNLLQKLTEGYRMKKPQYATEELYEAMKDCWNARATSRPTFTNLAERIGDMIEDDVKKDYLHLNEDYLSFNNDYFKKRPDYLAMIGSPDINNQSSDHHGYLIMKSDNDVDDDDDEKAMEMKPMLPQDNNNHACEISGSKSSSVSNPSYVEFISNNRSPEPSYINTRGGMNTSVDDYSNQDNSRQAVNRNMKLNWFLSEDKSPTTIV